MALAIAMTGCQAQDPLVPQEVYEQVNDDGREWTYDTAWQNIRMLNANLEAGNLDTIQEDALFIASQLERLEKGKAGPLTSQDVTALLDEVTTAARDRSDADNLREVVALGRKLQDSFDAGDFESAKDYALSVYATALTLSPAQ